MDSPLIFIFAVVVCVTSYFAAVNDFRGLETTVGIDLGTTYSVVAINKGKLGVTVVPNRYGKFLNPSVVSYLPSGDVVVGQDAVAMETTHPLSTIYESKRFLGRRYADIVNDLAISGDISSHPFRVVKDPRSEYLAFSIPMGEHRPDRIVTPIEVGAAIVKNMKESVNAYLGHSNVNIAVICAPAKFNREQRDATRKAFELAGFRVMRVLDEPSAAAIAYGFHSKSDVHQVIVYDFGGGTLDVSLLYINEGSVEVIGTSGDDHLGGSDFDAVFGNHLFQKVRDIVGKDIADDMSTALEGSCSLASLRQIGEGIKCGFSEVDVATVRCQHAVALREIEFPVTREEFEASTSKLFDRAIAPLRSVIEEGGLEVSNIDEVVLVGGSTRLKKVRAMVSEFFHGKKLNYEIDPDVTVAVGAASVVQ